MSKLNGSDLLSPADRLLTPAQFAEYVGTTVGQLAQQRFRGEGPRFVKAGKSVRYRWSDIQAWLDANTHQQTGSD